MPLRRRIKSLMEYHRSRNDACYMFECAQHRGSAFSYRKSPLLKQDNSTYYRVYIHIASQIKSFRIVPSFLSLFATFCGKIVYITVKTVLFDERRNLY